MRINILTLGPEEQPVPFSGALDLSYITRWGEVPFPEPVAVSGTARRKHGQTLVELTAVYTLHAACSRCLVPVVRQEQTCLNYIVVEQLESSSPEDWVEAPGGMLDLTEAVGADLLLALEDAILCQEDCKGLCPVCGADRNKIDCGCPDQKKADPRFAALLELLDNKDDTL